ncbi:MAG: hypothetical protein Q3976_03420 [Corynebacterium sp.]|nr:hypothetical protein [Corynebacterium sp.]
MKFVSKAIASAVVAGTLLATPMANAAAVLPSWRPSWDPTAVVEADVNPEHAEGTITDVSFTSSADGSKTVKRGQWAHVTATGSDFTPGHYYTVRIVLQTPGDGFDYGVYSWKTYQALEDGTLNLDFQVAIPNRAVSGEQVLAGIRVYSADDVGRDGRPNKVDEDCVLRCETVAPLAATTDLNDEGSIITIA